MRDWTKRRASGSSLVVIGLSGIIALISVSTIGYVFFTAVALTGMSLLIYDWKTTRAIPQETKLITEFIPKDLQIGSPFYKRLTGEVPGTAGILLVHNTGPSAIECHALVSVNDGIPDWPSQPVLAYWYDRRSSHISIESGGSAKIIIAVLKKVSWDYRWEVPHWLEEKLHSSFTRKFPRSENADACAHAHITVVVKPDSFPGDGLPMHSFIIEGQKIYESKS
jgi:hypothetical protein